MTRRSLINAAIFGSAFGSKSFAQPAKATKIEPVTGYVADFVLATRYSDIPPDVLELARKSILDGLGLALCGSVAKSGVIVRKYIQSLGFAVNPSNSATVIGSSLKAPARFAALANGIGIHADDYDDTQLAVADDRVYGLLTHPTAPGLPAAAGLGRDSGPCPAAIYCSPITSASKSSARSPRRSAPRHYDDGFHTHRHRRRDSASAAAAAKLLALDLRPPACALWASPPAKAPVCAKISAP